VGTEGAPVTRRDSGGFRIPALYAVVASADLVAVAAHWPALGWVSKPLLAPLLALALLRTGLARRSPMPAGLACATLGDIALLIPGTAAFIVGMAAFLGMQVFYIKAFRQVGGDTGRRTAAAYAVLWIAANAVLLPRAGALGPAIAIYSAALLTMAASARRLGPIGTWGGALFAVSDALIGVGVAGAKFPGRSLLIMVTYVLAQALLVYAYDAARKTRYSIS
jgi:uncharacterized membrane protein YhhN